MKHILVCVKAVPASTSVQVDGEYRLKRDGASLQWNIADESALEAALCLKDKETSVTVVTMGPPKLEAPLKELLARGADRAILVTDRKMAGADTRATAAALKAVAERIAPVNLILCGRRAIDGETGQVPGELAAALDVPCVSNAEKITRSEDTLRISRRLENGIQTLEGKTPMVISLCEYSYNLRLPGLLSMRRAKNKSVEMLSAENLGLSTEECGLKGSLTKVIAMESKFPGLRKGPKEKGISRAISTISEMIQEVKL